MYLSYCIARPHRKNVQILALNNPPFPYAPCGPYASCDGDDDDPRYSSGEISPRSCGATSRASKISPRSGDLSRFGLTCPRSYRDVRCCHLHACRCDDGGAISPSISCSCTRCEGKGLFL